MKEKRLLWNLIAAEARQQQLFIHRLSTGYGYPDIEKEIGA